MKDVYVVYKNVSSDDSSDQKYLAGIFYSQELADKYKSYRTAHLKITSRIFYTVEPFEVDKGYTEEQILKTFSIEN